jgi:hypothetical protein
MTSTLIMNWLSRKWRLKEVMAHQNYNIVVMSRVKLIKYNLFEQNTNNTNKEPLQKDGLYPLVYKQTSH